MKRRILYIAIVCIAAVVLIILLINAFQPETTTQSFDTDALITTATDASGNTVTHLYKQYSDTFTADTDIPADTPEEAEIYYAGYVDYDEELLLSLFMDGIETDRIVGNDVSPGIYNYEWADDSKKQSRSYLIIYNDMNEVRYSNKAVGDYYRYPTENFHTHQSIKGSINNLPLYETVYKAEELDFMSREEAVAYVKENVLDKLGYTVSEDVEIYAIDHETMQAHQDSIMPTDDFDIEMMYENYKIKETFTEEDDFYILCFSVEQDGIKLSGMNYFTMSTGRQVQSAYIRVHLNRDGIFYYESSGIMQMESTETEPQKLLTAQEAIDIAYNLYSSVISTDSAVLTEIAFEYASVPYNDDYDRIMLVPSWTIMLNYTSADGHEWIETLSVNAVTGEEIK